MEKNMEEQANPINIAKNVFVGLLIGCLAGAVTTLLFTPQSGQQTRAQIYLKSILLRDRATGIVNDELEQIRFDTHKIMANVQDKAVQIKQLGQEKIINQFDHVSSVIEAGKTAVESV